MVMSSLEKKSLESIVFCYQLFSNNWSVLLDYDPKCTFYPKRTLKGKVYFYLRYYLPGEKEFPVLLVR